MGIVVLIEPIETKTEDGTPARVTGIDMTSGDPFHGVVEFESGKFRNARWRASGTIRDGSAHWSLDLRRAELERLHDVATALGAKLS